MKINEVLYIFEFYDIPRKGIVMLNGKPFIFECVFNKQIDEYSNEFILKEITNENLIDFKDVELYKTKWDNKKIKNQIDKESYPVLPEDKYEYDTKLVRIENHLKINLNEAILCKAKFTKVDQYRNKFIVDFFINS
jgi:hypothetical protein